ncbi:hypothetical protein Tco_0919603 [Tanacetum coccineum]
MDEVDIEDVTIEQYLRLTQESHTPKKIKDMTIAEYLEYEKKVNENHISNTKSYLPTYFGKSTPTHNPIQEFAHYFDPNQPGAKSDGDSKDMEEEHFEEKDDVDEWLNAEMTKHMGMQGVENMKDALISIIKSIRQEMKDGIMKRQFKASTASVSDEVSSIANAKDNIMPQRVYEYLGLDKLRDASTLENTTETNEHLGTVNILVKFGGLEFSCNFIIEMDEDCIEKIYMVDTRQDEESFNPLEIGIDLFSYESPACLEFEQRIRSYGTPNPQDKIAEPISFSPNRRGLVKRWHVCKPIHVTYDDGSGKDCRMCSTCDPDSKFCFRYNEVFGNIDDTTRERRYYEWVAQIYEFSKHRTLTSTNLNDPIPTPQGHQEHGGDELRPIRPRPCNYSFEEWLKIRIGHNNLHESDHEFIFNEWILDSYDVEDEYAREIGDPYSRRFDKYRVFNNEIKHLSNEYILRIGKKGYVLHDVWEKCQQNYKKINEAWHDEAYKEDKMWQIGDEKTDYDPSYVDIKTFKVKKISFKGGRCFICITDREDEALPLGRMNGARFKSMIRKELEGSSTCGQAEVKWGDIR